MDAETLLKQVADVLGTDPEWLRGVSVYETLRELELYGTAVYWGCIPDSVVRGTF